MNGKLRREACSNGTAPSRSCTEAGWTCSSNGLPSVSTVACRLRPITCRVEDGRGGIAPFPVPAHQTGRADFPHPAFRLASPQGPRRRPTALASKASDGQFAVNIVSGELVRSTPLHFVSLAEEVPRSVIDMLIDGLVCRRQGAIGEVGRPTAQNAVQPCSHFVPGALVARHQQFADLHLDRKRRGIDL